MAQELGQESASSSNGKLTPFHQRLIAEQLSLSRGGNARLVNALSSAAVDLNPHQIDAAVFASDALARGGCVLADEVGLGKTIEAGLLVAQMCAEGKSRVLILCPAPLRAQWQSELLDKFGVRSVCVDGELARHFRGANAFEQDGPVIASLQFGANRADDLARIPWDLVVIDEAHRLRNAWKPGNKMGRALRLALEGRPKLLLTATPLQNDLMELYGLAAFLDESILGPEHAFRSRYLAAAHGQQDGANALPELRERLAPIVHRTLRRHVREYVKFTARRSIAEDFVPLPEEQDLYDKVSEYLRRADLLAIEPGKRTLLTLVYRKLLASSTYAIAPTLRKLADSLEERIRAAKAGRDFELSLEESVRDELRAYEEEIDEIEEGEARRPKPTIEALEGELFELKRYAELAESIRVNAKGEALCRALDRTFEVAKGHGWPRKAVIFTESKRTQDYLRVLLSARGHAGKISILSGDGSSPEARRSLVEEFRERTEILISTEAGAEGLNLQFCNLLINYDLPWNPQRVEQRIGRCHRYGQTRDVLVLNFVNRKNAAEARLYELLEQKLTLFDGVFGASDEILGALESGVDFERRVLDIYQSCRTEAEVNVAFDALRTDLDGRIGTRMAEAKAALLERFDDDVRGRLRLAGDTAKKALAARSQRRRALARSVLGREEANDDQIDRLARELRNRPVPAVSYLQLDGSSLPPHLVHLIGREGWWFAYRFELTGAKVQERLAHVVLLRDGNQYLSLALDEGEAIALLRGEAAQGRFPAPLPLAIAQEKALGEAIQSVQRAEESKLAFETDQLRERALRYAEDCLMAPREAVERARLKWCEARQAMFETDEPTERAKARLTLERCDRELRRRQRELRAEEDRRYADLDRALTMLGVQSKVSVNRQLIASAYFWIA
jgi:superfamily II DNA or RNA helicase